MVSAANLGFPRIGAKRELKKSLELYWKGDISESDLQSQAQEIRKINWNLQKDAGIDFIPSNDFSFYDQILDHIAMFGAVPSRYNFSGDQVGLQTYFAMARGLQKDGVDVVAMEMTKWFDTNYHYIVPEFSKDQTFKLSSNKIIDEFNEAKALGITTRPVLVGPITFLSLGKAKDCNKFDLLPKLLPVYEEILSKLQDAGAEDIQIDEPALVMDLDADVRNLYKETYDKLAAQTNLKICLTTYFEALGDNLDAALSVPFDSLHVDLVRSPDQLDDVLNKFPSGKKLSVGVVNGRNIWKTNFEAAGELVAKAVAKLGAENVIVAPSCSLLHSPVDLDNETVLQEELKNWLSFAKQKLSEIAVIAKAANGDDSVKDVLASNKQAINSRATSTLIHDSLVKQRVEDIDDTMLNRDTEYKNRVAVQAENLNLPLLPTTTIGSFPQTKEVRKARAEFKKGIIDRSAYDKFLEKETEQAIRFQEEIDIDVLVHGEFERNDMVEYFGEKLRGFAFTKFAWVQSYGSRCVKPPIIFGDVSRPDAMTVRWTKYAQSLTDRPVKGMLTGPVTILQWSFVRDDQPRSTTCKQIGLAIRDEVSDLEKAGIKVIQIDEPAIREGLPLRKKDAAEYLKWAVDSFKLSSCTVSDATQIHTHMCYSEFNDIMDSVAAMDADSLSIETSRSAMEILDAFVKFKYPNEIGPGVYDIHSPRVPSQAEMEKLLRKALEVLTPEQVWVNPDCGLKTRGWPEVKDALSLMVNAAKKLRSEVSNSNKASA